MTEFKCRNHSKDPQKFIIKISTPRGALRRMRSAPKLSLVESFRKFHQLEVCGFFILKIDFRHLLMNDLARKVIKHYIAKQNFLKSNGKHFFTRRNLPKSRCLEPSDDVISFGNLSCEPLRWSLTEKKIKLHFQCDSPPFSPASH